MMKFIGIVVLLVLAACSTGEPLPPIQGAWYALNPGRWEPSLADQATLKTLPEQ